MKILVVEDEMSIREEVVEWLTFEGYEVVSAQDGLEGLQVAEQTLPDLIISDITMPGLDGYGLLLELQKQPTLASIPFIFLTARADKSFVRHGMELGADDYVTKPFTRGELLSAIESRLQRHKSITSGIRQEVDDFKARLMRTVSHELKTPLTSLTLVRHIIERQSGQLTDTQIGEMLETMRAGTDRLQHIIEQIVYLTQLENGTLNADYVRDTGMPIYLWQLVPLAVDLAKRYSFRNREGGIAVVQHDNDLSIWGSSQLLKYALAELMANALTFSAEEHSVGVTLWESESYVVITILDQGVGMSSEEIARALSAFEQLDRDANEQQGLGLGLTIARWIIEIHGGSFELASVPGKGTQVTLSFPIYRS